LLAKHNNNRTRVAKELSISRVALYKKLHKLGMVETPA
jgi:transcriptional regulator with PAS, ATPase and Fis domain